MIFFKLLRGLASCWLNITFVWPSLVRCQLNGLKMKQITEQLVCMLILVQLIKLTEHMTGHVERKKGLAFSKFDAGGPEKLIINFAWPYKC